MLLRNILILFLIITTSYARSDNYKQPFIESYAEHHVPLVNDYFTWRNIKFLIFIAPNSSESGCNCRCNFYLLKPFSKAGFSISCQTTTNFLENIKNWRFSKIGVISVVNDDNLSHFDEIAKLESFKDNFAWLIILTFHDKNLVLTFMEKLRSSPLEINSDLVIADKSNKMTEVVNDGTNDTKIKQKGDFFLLRQVFKIRSDINTSFTENILGLWNTVLNTTNLRPFLTVEMRLNFKKLPFKFGKKNTTQGVIIDDIFEDYTNVNDEKFIEVANYFALFLNATPEIIYFQKLGYKETNGEWTDLFKAVINGEIDLGLENIIKSPEKFQDMSFTHKILDSIRNIYIKPQESNELRDIFLVPFGAKLILCVISIGVICSFMIFVISKITKKLISKDEIIDESLSEATIWCIGIFSLQGSVWKPNTYSGNIVLISSLIFAMLIFNSYSAFITSILSVEITNIKSVKDLLESDYEIGYARNSEDEIYLRSMNDTQMQQIYLRGFLQNTVNNITEGLLRATEGHYGFFASVNSARKELQFINNYRCTYDIMEIPILSTRSTIAFPLTKNSSYRKLIDLSVIKMYETGIYKYIQSLIVPDLPRCVKKRIFRSAHLPDLSTAFGILIIGGLLSVVLMVIECFWKRKQKFWQSIRNKKNNYYHHQVYGGSFNPQ